MSQSQDYQIVFDELIQFVLETISSENYLKEQGIHRQKIQKQTFKNRLNSQKSKNQRAKIKPGIYAISAPGRGSGVHFYGVREEVTEEGSDLKAGNGYPSASGLGKYSVGLDVQEDHSHGLCQTFALMYYLNAEDLLKKGESNYRANINIGLKFLINFINEDYFNREKCWTYESLLQNIVKLDKNIEDAYRLDVYISQEKLGNEGLICLTELIQFLIRKDKKKNLDTWFYNM